MPAVKIYDKLSSLRYIFCVRYDCLKDQNSAGGLFKKLMFCTGIIMMDLDGRGTIKARDSKNVQQMSYPLLLAFSYLTVLISHQIF